MNQLPETTLEHLKRFENTSAFAPPPTPIRFSGAIGETTVTDVPATIGTDPITGQPTVLVRLEDLPRGTPIITDDGCTTTRLVDGSISQSWKTG